MILLYAFANRWSTNISARVLIELINTYRSHPNLTFQKIYFQPQNFFRKYIHNNQYDLIIGLGDGMKFQKTIKIETQAQNSYRHQSINSLLPIYLDLSLPAVDNFDSHEFSIGTNMGTTNCNWIAFQTQYIINTKYPGTSHLFLHLPPRASASNLAQSISKLFQDNQLLPQST